MPKPFYLYCLDFPNGKKYIGITGNPTQRFIAHHSSASGCTYVRRAIKKYGSPQLRVLCAGDRDYILTLEETVIFTFNTRISGLGYNVAAGGMIGPMLGKKHSAETVAKIRAAHKGKPRLPETIAKMRAALTGRKLSPEHVANIIAGKAANPPPQSVARNIVQPLIADGGHRLQSAPRAPQNKPHR